MLCPRDLASAALGLFLLASGAGCDATGAGGGGTGGEGGEGGGGGGPSGPGPVVTVGTGFTAGTGTPSRTPKEICTDACACDAECSAASASFIAECEQRFSEDANIAVVAGCQAEHDAYVLCFANEWSCGAPDACDDAAEAFGTCSSRICERANELCGCYGCQSECRYPEERCYATCVVEAGSCAGDDAFYACIDACYGY